MKQKFSQRYKIMNVERDTKNVKIIVHMIHCFPISVKENEYKSI